MKNLLLICHGYPPYYGGAEHAAAAIAEQAARDTSLQVHVLTSDIGGRLDSIETRNCVHITRLPCRKKAWRRHSVPELLDFYRVATGQLDTLHAELKPDYIIAVFSMPAGLVARRWSKRHAVPYTAVLQGSDVPGYQPDRFAPLHPAMRMVARSVWSAARHVVAVSTPLAGLATKTWPAGQITIIPNGVDTKLFSPREEDAPVDRLRIAALSQLIPRKGLQHLLCALGAMPDEMLDRCMFDIHGDGPYRAALEKQSAGLGLTQRVTFHGLLERDNVPETLRSTDVFVHPSMQEGLPLAVLEAMASGVPVIATPVGDVPKIIRDGTTGKLVPPGNAPALQNALLELISNSGLRRELGREARKASLAYDWSHIWQQHSRLMARPTS